MSSITITCCACFDDYHVPSTDKTKCNHFLCKECTLRMCQLVCPLCRAYLESNYITESVREEIEKRKVQTKHERDNNLSEEVIRNNQNISPSFAPSTNIVFIAIGCLSDEERLQAIREYRDMQES